MHVLQRFAIPIALGVAGLIALTFGVFALAHAGKKAGPKIEAEISGSGYTRTVVVHVKDKKGGEPVRGADVTAQGLMTAPHYMPLIDRPLREVSSGTYRGSYSFIMKGDWTVTIDVKDKKGKETKRNFPIVIG